MVTLVTYFLAIWNSICDAIWAVMTDAFRDSGAELLAIVDADLDAWRCRVRDKAAYTMPNLHDLKFSASAG